jgi:hypothetical protein
MSDAVAVGLITAGTSVIVASLGAIVTYATNKRTAETAIATAERQSEAELRRIEGENARLREQLRDDHRRLRKDAYREFISAVLRLSSYARGIPTDETLDDATNVYLAAHSNLLLVASPEVTNASSPLSDTFSEIGEAMGGDDPTKPSGERWRDAYRPRHMAVLEGQGRLLAAMHRDVTQPIL